MSLTLTFYVSFSDTNVSYSENLHQLRLGIAQVGYTAYVEIADSGVGFG